MRVNKPEEDEAESHQERDYLGRIINRAIAGAIGMGAIGFLYMLFFVPLGPDIEGVLIMAGLGAAGFAFVGYTDGSN